MIKASGPATESWQPNFEEAGSICRHCHSGFWLWGLARWPIGGWRGAEESVADALQRHGVIASVATLDLGAWYSYLDGLGGRHQHRAWQTQLAETGYTCKCHLNGGDHV